MPSVKQMLTKTIEKSNKLKKAKDIQFKSTNNLVFEVAPHFAQDVSYYRVGTCRGIYSFDANTYTIIAVENDNKGNGHIQDVFDWFENSCKRDKKNLMVAEIMNKNFMKHLIDKRGFKAINGNNVIKIFR